MDTLPETHGIHVEERLTDGTYVLLAALPGVNPSDGIEITVTGGVLDLRAQASRSRSREVCWTCVPSAA
ncbi:hypothetical protein QNO09_05585 [Streptomyces sp. 378]|uniref:hypothetical protein n=1 Tax=Streptomyces sp. 378 TaxID=3049412 RepID=UPI0024C2F05F|nr:hypothetical protein [Streptomyces sp. 378]MDK1342780.1 hypothetical protein [Streptomyces sp. 378]